MALTVQGKSIQTTEEGFLVHSDDWSDSVCEAIAKAHSIDLSASHWEIIYLLRNYCAKENKPPSMRHLSKEIKTQLDKEKARSIYLMKLFGSSPAKMAAKLAGLQKPKNCL